MVLNGFLDTRILGLSPAFRSPVRVKRERKVNARHEKYGRVKVSSFPLFVRRMMGWKNGNLTRITFSLSFLASEQEKEVACNITYSRVSLCCSRVSSLLSLSFVRSQDAGIWRGRGDRVPDTNADARFRGSRENRDERGDHVLHGLKTSSDALILISILISLSILWKERNRSSIGIGFHSLSLQLEGESRSS